MFFFIISAGFDSFRIFIKMQKLCEIQMLEISPILEMERHSLNVLFSKGRGDYTTKGAHNIRALSSLPSHFHLDSSVTGSKTSKQLQHRQGA